MAGRRNWCVSLCPNLKLEHYGKKPSRRSRRNAFTYNKNFILFILRFRLRDKFYRMETFLTLIEMSFQLIHSEIESKLSLSHTTFNH